ncbi:MULTISPECIES: haloacid dehalogenase type II [unclassified Shewanella]|uniref:haloacid dehalogenase type II n=1 Tax=unclassified Shewanella TaxID=196818 RepID=UPI000C82506E|nr:MULTISPECIES: haloacid dehalogenase type II [unclassified Shewanella]MDO6620064.1 haloacid dehalogenase type II [Shewanella sp. 6_MG-2023]MDO6640186.1 haloacid dehalogenase type II [Shewanella sp. 5_MG-2023]MDO6679320.1 haloacid dehalogenase type II [Shewanella sp. 4_MG-2023]MDO6776787.1 haloacid dehalogenase type II [Shewanella sp. 3_MG-2023]PMG50808.1 haloacid dehalogenase, type II [Shewanella sp. 10N.286.52.B9]
MAITLAFDVYGTLINTHGLLAQLQTLVGDKAFGFSTTWREKQLEYSFRRGLMNNYVPFSECTRQALDYTCLYYQISLSSSQKQALLERYKTLPAFAEVKQGLLAFKAQGYRLFAFSNGTAKAVEQLLQTAGLIELFEAIVSADEINTFKPNPAIYQHFLQVSGSVASQTWLISSNSFDVTGAISAGLKAAWVKRSPTAIFDPWEIQPNVIATDLLALDNMMSQFAIKET